MNDSIKRISLDLHATGSREIVKVKRSDTGRKIYISLVDGGMPYHISEDCYAVFTGKKPDKNILFNDCTIEGNVIIYKLTEQTASVPGVVNCEIRLYGADAQLITSPKFSIIVEDTVYNEDDMVESEGEVEALTQLISDATEAISEANAAAQEIREARDNGEFDGAKYHFVNDNAKTTESLVHSIHSYATTPKVNDLVLTTEYDLYVITDVNLETGRVEASLVGNIKGGKGEQGEVGADGVSCTHRWNGTTLVVTSASGTTAADLKGDKGDKGDPGEDYVLTDEDKEEIAKMNTLTVTPPGDGNISSNPASHTPAEILAHVQSGGTAVLLDGESYAYLFSCDEENALFTSLDDGAKTYSYAIRSNNMIAYSKIEYDTRNMISQKITTPTTAEVGQTIVVKSVDSNGKPTKWETVDMVAKVVEALPNYFPILRSEDL